MRIVPMHLGNIGRDKSSFTCGRNQGVRIELPIIAWLVETNAEKIIVDTGTNAPERTAQHHKPLSRSKEQELPFVLKLLGVDPFEIKTVILTHLHWDHCYTLSFFPMPGASCKGRSCATRLLRCHYTSMPTIRNRSVVPGTHLSTEISRSPMACRLFARRGTHLDSRAY